MAVDTFNPKISDSSDRSPKRFKRDYEEETEEEKLAMLLVMLARGGRDSATEIAPPAMTAIPVATEPKRVNSHKCNVCNKAFSSHQALGGHKASHRAKPPTVISLAVEENKALNYVSALNPRGRIHKCSVCEKIFPTGQALGGHKRKHYEGVIGGAKSGATRSGGSSGVTSSTSSSHGESHRYVPDFDLNLPALPELELGL